VEAISGIWMAGGRIWVGRSCRYDQNLPADTTCPDIFGHKSGTMATAHEGQGGLSYWNPRSEGVASEAISGGEFGKVLAG